MNLVNSVFELAENFMSNPKYVDINTKQIDHIAIELKDELPPTFPPNPPNDIYKTCIMELVASSINYCYWYGRPHIRPLDSSSGKLKDIIIVAFDKFDKNGGVHSFDKCLDRLIQYMSIERFPMIEERIKHVNELKPYGQKFIDLIVVMKLPSERLLQTMVVTFPGFASDLFLKRAFLFRAIVLLINTDSYYPEAI